LSTDVAIRRKLIEQRARMTNFDLSGIWLPVKAKEIGNGGN
jgi:hypothetical protein